MPDFRQRFQSCFAEVHLNVYNRFYKIIVTKKEVYAHKDLFCC